MNTPISLTDAALRRLEKLCPEKQGLLINIKTTGCSGYAYDYQIIDQTDPEDLVYPQNNQRFIAVKPQHLSFIVGSILDYVKDGFNENFKFINPNEKGTCGCGESFTV